MYDREWKKPPNPLLHGNWNNSIIPETIRLLRVRKQLQQLQYQQGGCLRRVSHCSKILHAFLEKAIQIQILY